MKTRNLLTILMLATLALSAACGTSPHERAEEVMATAAEDFAEMNETVNAAFAALGAPPNCDRLLGVAPSVRSRIRARIGGTAASAATAKAREYNAAKAECRFARGEAINTERALVRLRDITAEEELEQRMTQFRTHIATTDEAALERVLNVATNQDEAWNALVEIGPTAATAPRLPPNIAQGKIDLATSIETMNEKFAEMAAAAENMARTRAEFLEILGIEDSQTSR